MRRKIKDYKIISSNSKSSRRKTSEELEEEEGQVGEDEKRTLYREKIKVEEKEVKEKMK